MITNLLAYKVQRRRDKVLALSKYILDSVTPNVVSSLEQYKINLTLKVPHGNTSKKVKAETT
jgi:hypothetical protein